jgi:release factor glutamine methyltransferase
MEAVTVLETIQRSTEFLTRKGVESPRLQAELLLAHVLRLPRMRLYLQFERELAPGEVEACRHLVQRRGQREPLQHIVGSVSFCGIELRVSAEALVPRPETELLAELGWKFLAERGAGAAALDFGTGTGCIAIALAARCAAAKVVALDKCAKALDLARENATRNGLIDRIQFQLCDDLASLPADAAFDLIISNPPYIPSDEIALLQPEVRDYDPRDALDGGRDGLDFYRLLATQARARLLTGGKLLVEFGDGQAPALQRLFANQNWVVEPVIEDYTQRPRILVTYPG